jgi:hypothetical protein
MQRKYIRVTELASSPKRDGRWPAARATIWRWVKTGRLPQPVRLSGGIVAWPIEVIEAFEAAASSTPTRTEAVQAAGLRSAAVRRARREGGEQ